MVIPFFLPKYEKPRVGLARCGPCGLSRKCISPRMKPTGKGKLPILFVAEAPGEQEDRQGVQLIGDAGQILRKALKSLGVNLDDCWKTNAVICRPPKNKIQDVHIESCRPNLRKTIEELRPKVIIALGASAVQSLLYDEWVKALGPLSRWVGWTIPSPSSRAWVCPTYHPSYIDRMNEDKTLVQIWKGHLQRAIDLADGPEAEPLNTAALQKQVEVITCPDRMRSRLHKLLAKRGLVAFDYETTGLKPDATEQRIYSVSFCFEGEETFAGVVDTSVYPVLSRVLRRSELRKVASNIKFEERWTRAKLGHGVEGWEWDTMLASHILDNRPGITSIKFQAYVHLGVPDYDSSIAPFLSSKGALNRIAEAPIRDLLVYNGMDSLLEFLVAKKQMEQMRGRK